MAVGAEEAAAVAHPSAVVGCARVATAPDYSTN